jgi:hypothetical protein
MILFEELPPFLVAGCKDKQKKTTTKFLFQNLLFFSTNFLKEQGIFSNAEAKIQTIFSLPNLFKN